MLEKTEKVATIIGTFISTVLAIIGFFTADKKNAQDVKAVKPEGIVYDYTWLLLTTSFLIVITIAMFLLIRYLSYQKKLNAAKIFIDSRYITSLNAANIKRESRNKSFTTNYSKRIATISGYNLDIEFESEGIRKTSSEEGYSYNLDSDNFIPFNRLTIYGHDLRVDSNRKNPVAVKLKSIDGNCKDVLVPFLKPVPIGGPFHVYMFCELPNSMVEGEDYYTSTLSSNQGRNIIEQTVTLIFKVQFPEWVRVYEIVNNQAVLRHELVVSERTFDTVIYRDEHKNVKDNKTLVYYFKRNFP